MSMAFAGVARLAVNFDKLTELAIITLIEHQGTPEQLLSRHPAQAVIQ